MLKIKGKGFTLVEIMVVVLIVGILFTALYMGVQPYMMRTRDTKRITSMLSYMNILDAYEKSFDTFPSNYGSGGPLELGYCLTEVANRNDISSLGVEGRFSALRNDTSLPPFDPLDFVVEPTICPQTRSFIYSRLDSPSNDDQLAVLAAKLEMLPSRNYGTGTDLDDPSNIDAIFHAAKGTVPDTAADQLYVVSRLHQ